MNHDIIKELKKIDKIDVCFNGGLDDDKCLIVCGKEIYRKIMGHGVSDEIISHKVLADREIKK